MSDLRGELSRLISEKRYDEARQLLQDIDHPKAKAFLAKIDAMQASESNVMVDAPKPVENDKRKDATYRPLNPTFLAALALFTTPVGAGMALAWNWRRLGKPEWAWWTLAGTFALLFTTVGLVLVAAKFAPGMTGIAPAAIFALALIPTLINMVYPFFISSLQSGAYYKARQGDIDGMLNHRYRFGRALLYTGTLVAVGTLACTLVFIDKTTPKTFTDGTFTLTYPALWQTMDAQQVSVCNTLTEQGHCAVVLTKNPFRLTSMVVIQETVPYDITLKDFEPFFWKEIAATNHAELDEYYKIKLDKYAAVQRTYTYRSATSSGYEMSIMALDGRRMFLIIVDASSRDVFYEDWPDIQAMLTSLTIAASA